MNEAYLYSAAGGALIGAAVAVMLLGAGRIAGISGIYFSVIAGPRAATRTWFLVGLVGSAIAATLLGRFDASSLVTDPDWLKLVGAGLLVGYGTHLGSGCTSGHGLCGIANGSGRGITATVIFMAVAVLVVGLGFGGL